MMEIGWVGLGQIGTGMARRLLTAGYSVTVYPRGQGLAEAQAAGAATCADYAALATLSDLLFLCVYDEAQVDAILFEHAALAALTPGSILLVHTTASPDGLRRIASRMPEGVALLDACFSGGPTDAAAGRLTLMVGGTADALERARAPLKCYSAHIDHVGEVGDGQLVKLLNNLLFATNVMNSVELLRLAEAQGLPPARAAAVIQRSSGASYAMELFARGGAPDDMMPAIRPYLEKDVASAVTAAKRAGIAIDAFAPTARFFEGPAVQERAPPGNPGANRTTRPSDR